MPSASHVLAGLAVIFAVTYLLRLAPFLLVSRLGDSGLVKHFGAVMPLGVLTILVLYTFRDVSFTTVQSAFPALAGASVSALVHLWRSNASVSILSGVVTYGAALTILGG